MKPLRIVIADDQYLFAEGLQSVLESRDPGTVVVGIAANGVEALDMVTRLDPDVVLMDVQMPLMDGVEATRQILEANPDRKILMLTTYDDGEYVNAALGWGARGYLLKDTAVSDLIAALHSTLDKSVILAGTVARNLAAQAVPVRNGGEERQPAGTPQAPVWLSRLGPRERQILKYLVQGCNNYDISKRLNLGEQTIKNYISGIYAKTDVHDRLLLMKALEGYPTEFL